MDLLSRIRTALTRHRQIAPLEYFNSLRSSFSIGEKSLLIGASLVFSLAAISLLIKVNENFLIEIPARGGELREGIVGTPRFVNPLLAISDADRDVASLVYSGLMRATPDGGFIPDLAERYSISPDGLTYTFILKSGATFHDGTPVTAEDVEFTVQKAQDSLLKSPRRLNWEGVTVSKAGTHEITFTLKQPYSPFIANTTLGILPKHVWQSLEADQFPFSQFNVEPIGSGPYRLDGVERSKDGIPTAYTLVSNDDYALGTPYIDVIRLSFYPNEKSLVDALAEGAIESASNISAREAVTLSNTDVRLVRAPLTRVFGIFFNHNQREILSHKEIRDALDRVLDKDMIVDQVLFGSGTVAHGALPPTVAEKIALETVGPSDATNTEETLLASLRKLGWTKASSTGQLSYTPARSKTSTPLSFSLTTSNVPELVETASLVESAWESLGAEIDVKIFEPSDLNQSVIRPRKYDALLFGLVVGRDPDLYAFWHSSQRNDPGLNIAMYTNAKADKALEGLRKSTTTESEKKLYADFAKEIAADEPAVFLYSPDFIYAMPTKVKDVHLSQITTPNDRFLSVYRWYINTDRVWKFLVPWIRKDI